MQRILYIQIAADLYGSSQALLHLLDALDRGRFSPMVMLPSNGPLVERLRQRNIDPIIAPHMRVLWSQLLRSWRAIPFGLGLLPSAIATRRLIHARRIDLVHSNAWTALSGALGARLARRPHIWHIREILRDIGGLKPALAAFTVRNASRILCISEAVAAQFAGQARAGQLRVIYDGLPPAAPASRGAINELRAHVGLPPNTRLLGVVGRLHPQKGQTDLLRAFALLPPQLRGATHLLVIGDALPGHEHLRAELEALAHQLGIAGQVHLLGFRPDAPALVAALEVLVLPATRPEGLGGVLLEAMAAGVPVVATRAGGPQEIITDGANGLLVDPNQPPALAAALARLLADPALGQRLGIGGRAAVEARFTASRMAAQVQAIYDEILRL